MDPANWRPITIGSVLARIYGGLLDRRFREISEIFAGQRGFMPHNGCFANCTAFRELLNLSKRGFPLTAALLDVSKAFDTVPHRAITRALQAQGFPPHLVELVNTMYTGVSTVLGVEGNPKVTLRRGVKQGDPLSPLLFNLVMDPLLRQLGASEDAFQLDEGGERMGVLAFADDITILSGSAEGAQRGLDTVCGFFRGLGMELAARKSLALRISAHRRSWVATDPGLVADGISIPAAAADTPMRYLGVTFTIARGISSDESIADLVAGAGRLRALSLKPLQKLTLIQAYILPRYMYGWCTELPSAPALSRLDGELRLVVKEMFFLHHSTTDRLLYTRPRDGGLGFPRLATCYPIVFLRNGVKLLNNCSIPMLGRLLDINHFEGRLAAVCPRVGLTWPVTIQELNRCKSSLLTGESNAWSGLASQGHGAVTFRNDRFGNCWLRNPAYLSASRHINALKLRTNTLGTRVACRRADPGLSHLCRRCGLKPESLGHVLGECIQNKPGIIGRHNQIVDYIQAECLRKKYKVAREQSYRVAVDGVDSLRKPDLVVNNGSGVFVADVTVRYEDRESLATAPLEKVTSTAPWLTT